MRAFVGVREWDILYVCVRESVCIYERERECVSATKSERVRELGGETNKKSNFAECLHFISFFFSLQMIKRILRQAGQTKLFQRSEKSPGTSITIKIFQKSWSTLQLQIN